MRTPLQTNQFTTTDGLTVHISDEYASSLYTIIDQQNTKYIATTRNYGKQIKVNLHFIYNNIENDGYTIYTDKQRKTKHLGNILASKNFNNPQKAERAIIDAVRKIATLTPMFIIALNEIENISMQIKTAPENTDNIPYLIQMMQLQLDYLKNKFPIIN